MSILLMVLKIIGIILLIIIGLLVLVTLLLLLVPVRYEIKCNFKDKNTYDFSVRISWLLRIIQCRLFLQDKVAANRITIFGIRLKKKKKVKTKNKKIKSNKNDKNIEKMPKGSEAVQKEVHKNKNPDKEQDKDNPESGAFEERIYEQKSGVFVRIKAFFEELIQKIRQTFKQICDTIKTVNDKLAKADEFIHDEKNIALFNLGKKEMLYLLKHYLPKKWKGKLLFGTGDPAGTGYALGTFYALYPVHGGTFTVIPDFDNKIFEGNFFVRGRIRGVHATRTLIHLFMNTYFRNMIFKKNGGNSSGRK